MSDQKHNPLSPEELFRLLDKKANTGLNEPDAFEQDALDGFAHLGSSEKAKSLVEEINTAISKKVSDDNKGTQKNRFIWFSAAASIILIVMISIFYVKQIKQESTKELALNDMIKKEELVSPDVLGSGESSPTPAAAVNKGVKETTIPAIVRTIPSQKKMAETRGSTVNQPPLLESAVSNGAWKKAKDESKNTTETGIIKKEAVLLDKIIADNNTLAQPSSAENNVLGKEKNKLEEEKVNDDVAVNTTNTKSATKEKRYNKADSDKSVISKKSFEKEKVASVPFAGAVSDKTSIKQTNENNNSNVETISTEKSANVFVGDVNQDMAYYTGGTSAIKEFVLNYLKLRVTKFIVGKYKISAIVYANGSLKVKSINQVNNVYCGCIDDIKESLNTMKNWVPFSNAGHFEDSDVEFVIEF